MNWLNLLYAGFIDLIWLCFSLQIDIALNFIVQHIYIFEVYRRKKLVLP